VHLVGFIIRTDRLTFSVLLFFGSRLCFSSSVKEST